MSRKQESAVSAAEPTADGAQVAEYLRRHPDFLVKHPELLNVLTPPAQRSGDGVVDMQRFMIERQRRQVAELQNDLRELVATSRNNLTGQNRVHKAVLALLGAAGFEHLVHIITTDLAVVLDLDVVTLCVEVAETPCPHAVRAGVYTLEPGTVDRLVGAGRTAMLEADAPGERMIFGGGAGLVRSQALLRLEFSRRGPTGVLALGSRRPGHFHPGQGTELLGFLASVLEHSVRLWLELPA